MLKTTHNQMVLENGLDYVMIIHIATTMDFVIRIQLQQQINFAGIILHCKIIQPLELLENHRRLRFLGVTKVKFGFRTSERTVGKD